MASSDERDESNRGLEELEAQVLEILVEEDRKITLKLLEKVRECRSSNTELEQLKYGKARLLAKRAQKQREVNDLKKKEEEMNEECSKLEQLIEQEKIATDKVMSECEAKMSEITERFRQTAHYYDEDSEEKMKEETRKANIILSDLLAQNKRLQREIDEHKQTLDNMKQDVPDNMSAILSECEAKMSEITERFRQTAHYYDEDSEEKMKEETRKANIILSDLLAQKKRLQREIDEHKQTLDNMKQDVPDNMSEILGETELKKKLQSLTDKLTHLEKKK